MPSEEMPERIWLDADSYNGAVGFAHPEKHKRDGWPAYIRADLCASGQQVRALVANLSVWDRKVHPDQQPAYLAHVLVYLAHVLAILDSNPAALTPAPQPEGQSHRSFPDAADGRPMPPMGEDLMAAGLSGEDARFVALQLAQNGLMLVPATPTAQEAVPVAWRSVERKFYRSEWPLAKLLEARNGGLVTDEGEAWSYRYTHKDGVGGEYDMLTRREPVAHPPQPSETVAEKALLQRAVDLIKGDLTGVEWKRACNAFVEDALRALKGGDA